MADKTGSNDFEGFEALRRYVPIAALTIAILVILIIPLKVISYGYLPQDDALGDAAKAVSGKSWPEILVLGPSYKMDHHFGWHWLLRKIYLQTRCDTDKLVMVEVAALFMLCGWSILACLKRPEAWLAAVVIFSAWSGLIQRLLIGRPLILTITALMVIFLAAQRRNAPPKWGAVAWMTALITTTDFLHGVWYLWALPAAAFFLAQQFRWGLLLAASSVLGTLLSAALTGHPVESILQSTTLALRVEGIHSAQSTLVREMRPANADFIAVLVVGGLVVLRRLAKLDSKPLSRTPAFWLALLGWVLGCQTWRFWEDWGLPALAVLVACDLQSFLETRFAADSFKRLGLACGLALTAYVAITNDVNSRWTQNLTAQYLTPENPDLKGWLPGKGGIIYSTDMTIFYQTFFKNPNADWRYVLGFESAYMTDPDFKVYENFVKNGGDAKTLKPWVDKMRPEDRLVARAPREAPPGIPQLEWNYGVSGIWIGRLPRTNAPPPAPTIPATEARTNSPSLTQ
jgi:hypothetical protein